MDPVEAAKVACNFGQRPEWGAAHGISRRLPDKLKQLVEACWAADYESRPEFIQIIATLEEVLRDLPQDPPGGGAAPGCSCAIM
ncbi:protein kinase [Monoraphidium neglectum]|uniref:Protein kinase n=1 Tax=Monoraphidium neglectum TaxID=145388 RepID=A0A0D2K8J5_9CHLO|nr:protein kinase [Monoraphidium neglectum]KIY92453.1 protein kinase [Monoraphidium neglectum]|eukprot:XP_013891473.1 protein kinase [Monoraphidium neglectum]